MNKQFNLKSRDDLFLSDDAADRDLYFHGEEGFDFKSEEASIPDMVISINTRLQQQSGKSREQLEEQYIQQQQLQPQM